MTEPVVLERTYPAAPEKVFRAWTDVDVLTTWYGCDTDMLWTVHAWDPRPGGDIHVSLDFTDPDGTTTPYVVKGRFVEVEPPRLLRYEWEAGQIVTVTIEPDGEGSRLRLEHAGLPTDEMCGIVTEGWTASLTQIEAAL